MPTVSIEFPDEVLSALRRSPAEFVREVRLAASIHWYQQGEVSQEKAAAIAGLDRVEFLRELAHRMIDVIHVDLDELRREAGRG